MINTEHLQQCFTSISNDLQDTVSRQYFNENYGYPAIPVVFRKAFQHLRIRDIWTNHYLSGILEEKECVEKSGAADDKQYLTLREYLQDNTPGYYYKTSRHLAGQLAKDYSTPEIFNCWYAATKTGTPAGKLSWLYVGKEGTFSETHRDIWWTSAWNYLVSGIKIWFLYPAAYTEKIRSEPEKYAVKNIMQDWDADAKKEQKPMICIQQPGDLIFVPGNYYHAVYNNGDTVSITENFLNETNYDLVRSYFRSRSNKNNLYSIESIIREGFSNNVF